MSGPRHECAIMGALGTPDAAELTYLGLYALQHRGQESSGIVSFAGGRPYVHKAMGLVADIFTEDVLSSLPGACAIGHNRYSTTGSSNLVNAQPILANLKGGSLAISHNGNLVNARELRDELEQSGAIFQSTVDSEVVVHLIARSREPTLDGRVLASLQRLQGAFSLLILAEDALYAARDPNGFRPLCLGTRPDGKGAFVASETCALDIVGAELVREIHPGELLKVTREGFTSLRIAEPHPEHACIFELIYFARPDSRLFGISTDQARRGFGRELAREHPVEADCVFSVPDSSNAAALGYAEESGLPFELALIRNHYVGRTFIQPTQAIRDFGVKVKYNPVRSVIRDRRVVVVDDSIVRGTTSKALVRLIREAGAREVHLRVSSPPLRHPCYYGVDIPVREDLIAANMDTDELRTYLDLDSLGYLSREGMYRAVGGEPRFCDACFTGDYPVRVEGNMDDKLVFERTAGELGAVE
ncbi:MAG: amidophosphoribosyltransferase [Gemmatimonadetes bacterium]|nr:amidophosphoribosyltransferase [Gemmatimonadota bacterium]